MHEMSIVSNIFDIAEKSLQNEQQRLTAITVQVGELAGVEIEALQFCFDAIKQSTSYPDVKLTIKNVPGKGKCEFCGEELHIDQPFALCPHCENYTVRVTGGQELKITSLEVEEKQEI